MMNLTVTSNAYAEDAVHEVQKKIEKSLKEKHEEAKKILLQFAEVTFEEKISGRMSFSEESIDKLDELRENYNQVILAIERERTKYEALLFHSDSVMEMINNWFSDNNNKLEKSENYLMENSVENGINV
ncbi:hypothetical protein [Proteiniclasticum sp.]|uniref:hypothetical protein n=1 Tax=Proteiniclasticum sp. TaxID=2053595 RepID=UPI0025DD5762|nr:hypothetical protein [Proteiniclasticum sp.]